MTDGVVLKKPQKLSLPARKQQSEENVVKTPNTSEAFGKDQGCWGQSMMKDIAFGAIALSLLTIAILQTHRVDALEAALLAKETEICVCPADVLTQRRLESCTANLHRRLESNVGEPSDNTELDSPVKGSSDKDEKADAKDAQDAQDAGDEGTKQGSSDKDEPSKPDEGDAGDDKKGSSAKGAKKAEEEKAGDDQAAEDPKKGSSSHGAKKPEDTADDTADKDSAKDKAKEATEKAADKKSSLGSDKDERNVPGGPDGRYASEIMAGPLIPDGTEWWQLLNTICQGEGLDDDDSEEGKADEDVVEKYASQEYKSQHPTQMDNTVNQLFAILVEEEEAEHLSIEKFKNSHIYKKIEHHIYIPLLASMARSSGAPDLCTKEQTKKALEELSPQDLRVLQNVLLADDMGEENFAVITEWLSDTADWSTEKILEKICPGHRKSVLKKSQHLKRMAQKVLDMEVYALANTVLRDEIFRLLAKQIKDRSDAANKATAREHAEKEAAKQKADADHHQAVQAKKAAQDAHAKHLGDVEKIANDAADRDAKAKKTQDAYLTAQKKHDEDQKKLDALRKKASKAQENHLKHAGQHVSAEKEKEEKQNAKKQAEAIADAKLKVAESANAEHAKATKALIDQDAADKANKKLVDKLNKVKHNAHVMNEAATHFSGVHDNQDAIKPHGHRRLEQDRRLLAGAK